MANIPYQNMEIEQIYTQLLSQKKASLAVCSAESGEGVTSLAMALAQRCLLAGHATLLVDLNLHHPALKSLLEINAPPLTLNASLPVMPNAEGQLLNAPQLISCMQSEGVITGVVAPTQREKIIKLRQPGTLEECIAQWLQQYDTVIIDCSPINRVNAKNIPPERVAAACTGALLTVLAGITSEAAIDLAVAKLNNAQAQLLGCVLNDQYNPTLKAELIRETQRLMPLLSCLIPPLKKVINQSHFLSLEI